MTTLPSLLKTTNASQQKTIIRLLDQKDLAKGEFVNLMINKFLRLNWIRKRKMVQYDNV